MVRLCRSACERCIRRQATYTVVGFIARLRFRVMEEHYARRLRYRSGAMGITLRAVHWLARVRIRLARLDAADAMQPPRDDVGSDDWYVQEAV